MLFTRSMALARREFRASRARPRRSGSAFRDAARGALRRLGRRIRGARTGPRLRATAGRKLPPNSPGAAVALVLAPALEWIEEGGDLIPRLRELAAIAELPRSLRDTTVPEQALPRLADEAAGGAAASAPAISTPPRPWRFIARPFKTLRHRLKSSGQPADA